MSNHAKSQTETMASREFLAGKGVFTVEEFARHIGGVRSLARARARLGYYVALGRVRLVAGGVYAADPGGGDALGYQPDPFVVAVVLRPDGVFCHHSSLELMGQAHSVWRFVTLYTTRRRSPLKLGRVRIVFLAHPPKMMNGPTAALGRDGLVRRWTRATTRGGRSITMTSPERLLVEGVRALRWVGGVDELFESAQGFASLNLGELWELLALYDSPRLWAALGWFLERNQATLYVPDNFLNDLERKRPKSPVYLEPGHRGGLFARRWNLMVPAHLGRKERDEPGP